MKVEIPLKMKCKQTLHIYPHWKWLHRRPPRWMMKRWNSPTTKPSMEKKGMIKNEIEANCGQQCGKYQTTLPIKDRHTHTHSYTYSYISSIFIHYLLILICFLMSTLYILMYGTEECILCEDHIQWQCLKITSWLKI